MSDKNKKVRDSSASAFNKILAKNLDIAEAEMNAVLDDKKSDDELRKYKRPDEARHLGDDMDSSSVDAMLEVVSKRFDISARYYKLKAKLLGLSKLEYHERNVPYGNLDKKYSYEDSLKLVHKTLSAIDKNFGEIIEGFINQGRADVFPAKGKRDGAFCVHWKIEHPTYLLFNHTDKLNDVLTLAHEFGHGINNELMRNKQNSLNFETPLSTAEVASTFMEDFVLDELMKEANEELRLALMVMKLNSDISTIFRQVACYRFEQELHEGFRDKGYLSKEDIGKIFQKWMSAYMGPGVEQSSGAENWWIYWSHIRSFFYVYSYASGLLISKSLQHSVKKNKKFVEKVNEFLSAGTSDSPRNIFLKTGIDIHDKNFWESGIAEIESLLNETEKLAKKLGKI